MAILPPLDESMKKLKKINKSWSRYDKVLAGAHLHNWGVIYVDDEYLQPIEVEDVHYLLELEGNKEYVIEITEVLQKRVVISAESRGEAIKLIEQQYKREDIVLAAEDLTSTEITCIN